jgi:Cu/Ag efflux protein CusF
MIKTHSLVLAAALAVIAIPGLAETKSAPKEGDKPGGVVATTTTTTSKITAIDYKSRIVTLTNDAGQSVQLHVGPQAKNFDQAKVGDIVTVESVESVGIFVTPKGEVAPAAGKTSYIQTAKPGHKPGGIQVETETLTATVTAIDHKTRMVTIKGPMGETRTFKVGPAAKRLDEVKVGDEVTVTVTVGTAISVNTPPKKK